MLQVLLNKRNTDGMPWSILNLAYRLMSLVNAVEIWDIRLQAAAGPGTAHIEKI